MPCSDGGPTAEQLAEEAVRVNARAKELAEQKLKADQFDMMKEKLDYVTDMLCRVMVYAEKNSKDGCPFWDEELLALHPGLPKWWSDHKKADAKRREAEAVEYEIKHLQAKLARLKEE